MAVAVDGGDRVDVGPAKCQAVLAALALSAGDAVPVSRLIDVVWGEDPPATAEKTLQGYVSRLRKALGSDSIIREGAAYRLALDENTVDVARFRRHLDAGDVEAALREWSGAPLAGLDVPGLRPAVDGLMEQWLSVVQADLERRVATDGSSVIPQLAQLTSDHPFREELWALLMKSLYQAGRQRDALAAFQKAREHLVEELGVEPGPALRALEAAILEQADELRGDNPPTSARRPTGTVTFGFCEVDDAERLWREHQRKMAVAMMRLDTLVREVADHHSGTLISTGDHSFGMAFDRVQDAASWAIELQVTVDREPWSGGVPVRLRVGLHTGEGEESPTGYFSPAVRTAARLTAAGHGGQTLLTGVAAALLERDDLRWLGTYRLEGDVGDLEILQLGEGAHPPLRHAPPRRGNLPVRLPRLVGRDADLDAVEAAIEVSPVVTLVGPGGVGKTALALAAARRCEGVGMQRVWLVELAEINQTDDVLRAVAASLGVLEGAGRTLMESLVAVLRSRPSLLVLDNCEHVIESAATLAHEVASQCPTAHVLATSREALGVDDERLIAVAPLDPAGAAIELFEQRAGAASATLDLSTSRREVAEICRRLDGVPLAIELAAARIRSLTPSQLLARLDDRLRLLVGGRRTGGERHRTLRATLQWSYDLLTPAQQRVFQRLSVFTGVFDLAGAEAVAAGRKLDAVDVDRIVDELVERSMITVEAGPFGRQFRLLETVRAFAAEHLAEHEDARRPVQRHAEWCRDQIQSVQGLLVGPREAEGVARLAELWPNLRAAVDWACTTGHLDLADALVRPVATEVNMRRRAEIGDWAEQILDLTPADRTEHVVFWLTWAADRHMQAGRRDAYEHLVERHGHRDHPLVRFTRSYLYGNGEGLCRWSPEAIGWLRAQGDGHAADLIEILGLASGLLTTGRFDELDALASALVTRHGRHGPRTLLYWALGMRGYAAQLSGDLERASHFFAEAGRVELPAGTPRFHVATEARTMFERGDTSPAFRLLRDHIEDLLDTDYTDAARLIAVEYINLMVAIDRLPEAARTLTYLDTVGDFGGLARDTVVADAASKVAADPELTASPSDEIDARAALTDMHAVLDAIVTAHDGLTGVDAQPQ